MYEFAKSLKGHLKAYLIPCLKALLDLVTDKHSAEVRSSSSLALARYYYYGMQCNAMITAIFLLGVHCCYSTNYWFLFYSILVRLFEGILDAVEKGFITTEELPAILAACLAKLLESLKVCLFPLMMTTL